MTGSPPDVATGQWPHVMPIVFVCKALKSAQQALRIHTECLSDYALLDNCTLTEQRITHSREANMFNTDGQDIYAVGWGRETGIYIGIDW